ncbi:MAG: hypothetical protein IPP83_19800 [Flavobacteriales bacterium]|nr:hypothetical protein [Flavobacteriales bacterium]
MKHLTVMIKRITIRPEAVLLAAALALLALTALSAPATTRDEVVLTGWLQVEDHNAADIVLSAEVNDNCLYAEVEGSGRFSLSVPAGSRVVLTFSKPGHLTKEVVVDTRNALATPQAERTNRKVRFDVVLEPVRKRPGCKYDGPVGSLAFVNGSGTMKVKHTFSVVADQAIRAED